MSEEDRALVPSEASNALFKSTNELVDQIIAETDTDKLNDLTELFELNTRKKNIARINKLSNLQELVDDEVILRFTSEPETFDNDQLLKYMDSMQKNISAMQQSLNQVPVIQINNQKNEIHVNESGLDRESRKKVLDAVRAILEDAETNIVEVEGEETWEET